MRKYLIPIALSLVLAAGISLPAGAQQPGSAREHDSVPVRGPSGLPLPRFVSLGADKVNLRTGPGSRYPIEWVYIRKGLPVEVLAEYDLWRQIRDIDGDEGWVHKQLLSGKRFVIAKADIVELRGKPEAAAPVVLRAAKGVQASLKRCNDDWCRIEIDGTDGWVQRAQLWGIYPAEIF